MIIYSEKNGKLKLLNGGGYLIDRQKAGGVQMTKVFLNPRVKEKIAAIPEHKLTIAVAPMGYGKSTIISHFVKQIQPEGKIMKQYIHLDDFDFFWMDLKLQLNQLATEELQLPIPGDAFSLARTIGELSRFFQGQGDFYWVIEDVHLMKDARLRDFMMKAVQVLPDNLRIILTGRSNPFSTIDMLQMGHHLLELNSQDFRLLVPEIQAYGESAGSLLTLAETERIYTYTEGWFSAVFLILKMKQTNQHDYFQLDSIYEMIQRAYLNQLPQETLAELRLLAELDSFTQELVLQVYGPSAGEQLLTVLSEISFVQETAEGIRMHQMLRTSLADLCELDEAGAQAQQFYCRLNQFYFETGKFFEAAEWAEKTGDHLAFFQSVAADGGQHTNSRNFEWVVQRIMQAPAACILQVPMAPLIMMFIAFAENQMATCFQLKELILATMAQAEDFPQEEKENILGDIAVVEGFLEFNSISKMGRCFRAARELLHRPTYAISPVMPWTFGSPSVLALYHQQAADLMQENADMNEFMEDYYLISDGHGMGAAHIFTAERLFMQGAMEESFFEFYLGEKQAQQAQQDSLLMCVLFHRMRKNLLDQDLAALEENRRQAELIARQTASVELEATYDLIMGYIYAQMGDVAQAPEWLLDRNIFFAQLSDVCKPIYLIIHGALHLALGNDYEVAARETDPESVALLGQSVVSQMYYHIQQAAAWQRLKQEDKAQQQLTAALAISQQNGFVMPFVDHWGQLGTLRVKANFPPKLWEQIQSFIKTPKASVGAYQDTLSTLEQVIVERVQEKRTNQEIAQRLSYSEGTIKQYLNRIYTKMGVDGGIRNKRLELAKILERIDQ